MATYGELKNFTYGELKQMQLTYGDLNRLSIDELIEVAKKKIDRFKILPDDTYISEETSNQIQQIYQKVNTTIPDFNIKPQVKWSKEPTEILFTAICAKLAERIFDELPKLIPAIISVIDQILD